MWDRVVDWFDDIISDPAGYLIGSFVIIASAAAIGTHFLFKYFPPQVHPCR